MPRSRDEQRRRELLLAVIATMAETGIGARSLRDIAAAAGTSHRMLLHHFGSRDELLVAVVEEVERRQQDSLAELPDDPLEAARAHVGHLRAPELRPFERLFFECYARAAQGEEPFNRLLPGAVDGWLAAVGERAPGGIDATAIRLGLAVTRGLLLDLVATGDEAGVDAAYERFLALLGAAIGPAATGERAPRRRGAAVGAQIGPSRRKSPPVDVLPSRLAVSELAVGAVAAASLAAADLSHARRGPRPAVRVDGRAVSAVFRSDRLVQVDGAADSRLRRVVPVLAHARRLGAHACQLPASPRPTVGRARAVADRPRRRCRSAARGAQVSRRRGRDHRRRRVCAAVRTAEEWREHPQALAVRALPLVSTTRLGDDAPPRRLPPPPLEPLLPAAGLRVLDLTRVIAGPVATATLALLGAEVLRLDPPLLPELPEMHVVNGMGKRSALLDVGRDRELFHRLVASADVVVTGYRPGALDRYGAKPDDMARLKPGLVVASLSAWGAAGPWARRRGFDSIVQAASGVALVDSPDGTTPGALPAQALDYATGFLLAAGILAAVARQHTDGGSVLVQAHLARTAAWLLEHPDDTRRVLPVVSDLLHERRCPIGQLRYPLPAIRFDGGPRDWPAVGGVWGADRPSWL